VRHEEDSVRHTRRDLWDFSQKREVSSLKEEKSRETDKVEKSFSERREEEFTESLRHTRRDYWDFSPQKKKSRKEETSGASFKDFREDLLRVCLKDSVRHTHKETIETLKEETKRDLHAHQKRPIFIEDLLRVCRKDPVRQSRSKSSMNIGLFWCAYRSLYVSSTHEASLLQNIVSKL